MHEGGHICGTLRYWLLVGRMIEKMPGSPHLKHLPCACSGASEAICTLCVQYACLCHCLLACLGWRIFAPLSGGRWIYFCLAGRVNNPNTTNRYGL